MTDFEEYLLGGDQFADIDFSEIDDENNKFMGFEGQEFVDENGEFDFVGSEMKQNWENIWVRVRRGDHVETIDAYGNDPLLLIDDDLGGEPDVR